MLSLLAALGCTTSRDAPGGGTATAGNPSTAAWPMPNEPGLGLPNERHYALDRADSESVVLDVVTGLAWQRNVPSESFSVDEAERYCDDLTLGQNDDFRLPTRIELVSLLDLGRSEPAIDPEAFPATPGEWFWSSSRSAGDPTRAWYAYFYFGYPDLEDAGNAFRVRCVSSAGLKKTTGPRFDVRPDTARDLRTGLTWQRGTAPAPLGLFAARDYCAELDLAGEQGFRLPTMPELETLVDETTRAPAIDADVFAGTPSVPFWTGSAWAGSAELAWYVSFDYGAALYDLGTTPNAVRCVR